MYLNFFVKEVSKLDHSRFLQIITTPALIFNHKFEKLPEFEQAKKTDAFFEHMTVEDLNFEQSDTPFEEAIEFLGKSERNPFQQLITLGRASNNDIVINDPTISKVHVFFVKNPEGQWQIIDKRSTNHTYLDGMQLNVDKKYNLYENSLISFGFKIRANFYTPQGLWSYLQMEKFSKLFVD